MIATVIMALVVQAGQHELVVRFPGNDMGYNRVYRSLAACERAQVAIRAEYDTRVNRMRRDSPGLLIPPAPPTAICVPL